MDYYEILNTVIVYGGRNEKQELSDMFMLRLETSEWVHVELHGEKEFTRLGHCTAVYGEKLLVLGGISQYRLDNSLLTVDLNQAEVLRLTNLLASKRKERKQRKATMCGDAHSSIQSEPL